MSIGLRPDFGSGGCIAAGCPLSSAIPGTEAFCSMKTAIPILALCVISALPAFAQNAPAVPARGAQSAEPDIDYETAHLSRIAAAVRTTERIVIDGRLDERA